MLGFGRYVADRGGEILYENDLTQTYAFPRVNTDTTLYSYTVPSGKIFEASNLQLCAYHSTVPANTFGALENLGTLYFRLAGVDKFEARVYREGLPTYGAANAGEENCTDLLNYIHAFSFGDGLTIPAGTSWSVHFTPASAFRLIRLSVSCFGSLSGVADIRKGSSVIALTGTTTVLTYTPGTDYTLNSIYIASEKIDQLLGGVSVQLNGQVIYENPMLVDHDSHATFYGDGGNGHYMTWPLTGMVFREGDTIRVSADPIAAHNGVFTAHLSGTETDVPSGGGGGGGSFVFVG